MELQIIYLSYLEVKHLSDFIFRFSISCCPKMNKTFTALIPTPGDKAIDYGSEHVKGWMTPRQPFIYRLRPSVTKLTENLIHQGVHVTIVMCVCLE